MTSQKPVPSLTDLEYIPYLDQSGDLPQNLQGKIGVYAIFDQEKQLQIVNYSRDVYLSIKQHLVRRPQACHWLKVETIERPSRTRLENIKDAWIKENGVMPAGNAGDEAAWNQPIDIKPVMTADEIASYGKCDELMQIKLLKKISRRVENKILEELKSRGVTTEIRFNPKMKEKGLLDLK